MNCDSALPRSIGGEDSSPKKRPRNENENPQVDDPDNDDDLDSSRIVIRADKIISLNFAGHTVNPSYTHQLFDDELLCFDATKYSESSLCSLRIDIDIFLENNIQARVNMLGCDLEESQKIDIMEKLQRALPAETISTLASASTSPCIFPTGRLLESFAAEGNRYEIWLATHM
jgi:hypothetical protein